VNHASLTDPADDFSNISGDPRGAPFVDGADLEREAARPKALAPCGAVETVTRGDPYKKKRDPPAFPPTGPRSPTEPSPSASPNPASGSLPNPYAPKRCERRASAGRARSAEIGVSRR
jgi:hypothetical protein